MWQGPWLKRSCQRSRQDGRHELEDEFGLRGLEDCERTRGLCQIGGLHACSPSDGGAKLGTVLRGRGDCGSHIAGKWLVPLAPAPLGLENGERQALCRIRNSPHRRWASGERLFGTMVVAVDSAYSVGDGAPQ
jgi:hypothetical protein